MAVRQPPRVIAGARIRRLRECALEDWIARGGHVRGFDAAWPAIQSRLLPRGANCPGVDAPRATETIRNAVAQPATGRNYA